MILNTMGKPFKNELLNLNDTIKFVETIKVDDICAFLSNDPDRLLICIGSGGSLSACHYASLLYKEHCSMAVPYTPLQLQNCNEYIWQKSKLLFISASGKNNDIKYVFKKATTLSLNMANICLRADNPLAKIVHGNSDVISYNIDIPTGKDGFLATNSLVALYCILFKCFYRKHSLAPLWNSERNYELKNHIELESIQNFSILYGRFGEPVAYDIESKMSEAALGTVQLADFRNFGHGRHHWFAKRGEGSCLLVLTTPEDEELANKTISLMPDDIPVIYLKSKLDGPLGSIDLLLKSFNLIQDVGEVRAIDPGRPGVPSYGSLLYNLNFASILKRSKKKVNNDFPILEKCRVQSKSLINDSQFAFYEKALEKFVKRINSTLFDGIVFDYDGTICSREYRWKNRLQEEISAALENLLNHGIHVCIATGRGRSIVPVFKKLAHKYPNLLSFAYYNGMVISHGEEDIDWDSYKEGLDENLSEIIAELRKQSPYSISLEKKDVVQIDCRKKQVTIKSNFYSSEICELCREIIVKQGKHNVKVWQSSHSMDVVIQTEVSKTNIITSGKKLLCIGDRGDVDGNDFELLSTPYSLSVGTVSRQGDSCWNLAPYGKTGVDATLWYLRQIKFYDGKFKIKFKL